MTAKSVEADFGRGCRRTMRPLFVLEQPGFVLRSLISVMLWVRIRKASGKLRCRHGVSRSGTCPHLKPSPSTASPDIQRLLPG